MTSLYKILKSAKLGAGAAQDFHTAIMAQKMPFAKRSGAEHEYTGAVPVTFTANGQPLLDYLISGNTVQNGTPTPDSPIMPQGSGERTGNLFDKSATDITNGYAIDYYLLITGEKSQYQAWRISEYIPVSPNVNYYLKWDSRESVAATTPSICFYSSDKSYIGGINYNNRTGLTFTTPNNTAYIRFSFIQSQVDHIMLNEGSTALPYEPFGVKIPILSNGTTTPLYLGEVQTTRKIKKLVLDGTEEWYLFEGTNIWQFYINNDGLGGIAKSSAMSNIAPYGTTPDDRQYHEYGCYLVTGGAGVAFQMKGAKDTFTNIAAWKAYLAQQYAAGTPVCVWYVLATPETGIVNEPLMKIGDYADTLSHAQAGVSIPTANGSTTLDVETAIKPSEIYIKYKSQGVIL